MPMNEKMATETADIETREDQRRPFVEPELRSHEALPKVTTGFVGTFQP